MKSQAEKDQEAAEEYRQRTLKYFMRKALTADDAEYERGIAYRDANPVDGENLSTNCPACGEMRTTVEVEYESSSGVTVPMFFSKCEPCAKSWMSGKQITDVQKAVNASLRKELDAERAKLQKVREALEFYGDKKNWGTYPEDESSGKNALLLAADSEHYSDVWVGHRARKALALLDGEGE